MGEYNIDETARLSGITVRSLRNYVHQYGEFLSLKRGPYNALIFGDEDLTTLVKVKALLRDGKSKYEICDALDTENGMDDIQVTRNALATEAPVLLPILKKIDSVMGQLLQENLRLQERLQRLEDQASEQTNLVAYSSAPPALPPATRGGGTTLELTIPYFVLAFKDGCTAYARSVWTVFFRRRTSR